MGAEGPGTQREQRSTSQLAVMPALSKRTGSAPGGKEEPKEGSREQAPGSQSCSAGPAQEGGGPLHAMGSPLQPHHHEWPDPAPSGTACSICDPRGVNTAPGPPLSACSDDTGCRVQSCEVCLLSWALTTHMTPGGGVPAREARRVSRAGTWSGRHAAPTRGSPRSSPRGEASGRPVPSRPPSLQGGGGKQGDPRGPAALWLPGRWRGEGARGTEKSEVWGSPVEVHYPCPRGSGRWLQPPVGQG